METKFLKINPADNVAVAIAPLSAGEKINVDGQEITLNEDIPAGHKFALKNLAEGENVIKYGYPIGHAREARRQGDWMNEHNIQTNLSGLLEYTYHPVKADLDIADQHLTFKGYRRKNGDVGVRNEIWIIPTVGCVNGIANQLAEALRAETGSKGVDAIMAYPHNYGCSQLGDDHENTKKYCATWCSIPMPEPCWSSAWVARTTSRTSSASFWMSMIQTVSSFWWPKKWTTNLKKA